MKTRFSTIDLRAVLAELNARYCTAGDQAHAESARDRGQGPTVQNRTSPMFSLYSALCHSSVDPVRPGWASASRLSVAFRLPGKSQ